MNTIPGYDAWKLASPPDDGEAYERWADQHTTETIADATADALTAWITTSTSEEREAVAALRTLLEHALRSNRTHIPGRGTLHHHLAELAAAVDVAPTFEAWCNPEEDTP